MVGWIVVRDGGLTPMSAAALANQSRAARIQTTPAPAIEQDSSQNVDAREDCI